MAQFKSRWKTAKPTIKLMETHCPYLLISEKALAKMRVYVEECTDEIGWLGSISEEANDPNCYFLDDVFLFDQEVHATTTEISPEGLADFANKILQEPDGVDLWNRMCAWGHSHVNMGVTPSGQDDAQMKTFEEGRHHYFFRLICNKAGEIKVDMYDYRNGIIYTDIPWDEEVSSDYADISKQIKELQSLLDNRENNLIQSIKEDIKKEMSVKVKKKSWGKGWNNNTGASTRTAKVFYKGNWGYWENGIFHIISENEKQIGFINEKKSNSPKRNVVNNVKNLSFFGNDEELVYGNFQPSVLVYMGELTDEELDDFLVSGGWTGLLKEEDFQLIKRVAQKVYTVYQKEISQGMPTIKKLKFPNKANLFQSHKDVIRELGHIFIEECIGKDDAWIEDHIVDEGFDDYVTREDFLLLKEVINLYAEGKKMTDGKPNN